MRFVCLDRIIEVEPGRRLVAEKCVSLAEEYLADHFPTFPVMPGVLMLQAMAEAAAWLVHISTDFAHSLVYLEEVKSATYKSFLKPGDRLRVEVSAKRIDESGSDFVGLGLRDGEEVVRARLALRHANLAGRDARYEELDRRLIHQARSRWVLLGGSRLLGSAAVSSVPTPG